jgi:hypothetical protein
MTAKDIAPGYKQLLEVERGWRDMKQIIVSRPRSTTRKNGSAPAASSAGSSGISVPPLGR